MVNIDLQSKGVGGRGACLPDFVCLDIDQLFKIEFVELADGLLGG